MAQDPIKTQSCLNKQITLIFFLILLGEAADCISGVCLF